MASSPSGGAPYPEGAQPGWNFWVRRERREAPSFIHGLAGRRVERLLCASHLGKSQGFVISLTVTEALC